MFTSSINRPVSEFHVAGKEMNKSVLWLIKTYFFLFFFDVFVAVAVVVAKAHSTRIRIFLNPQIVLCGFKNYHVHT